MSPTSIRTRIIARDTIKILLHILTRRSTMGAAFALTRRDHSPALMHKD
jgi:hypothetical protein